MTPENRRIVLASRPQGWPTPDTFRLERVPVPQPTDGQVLVRVLWLSVDPYMRGRIRDVKSYAPPVALGQVMVGGAVARVEASEHPHFSPGQIVVGPFGWQDYALSDGKGLRVVDPALAPLSTALGVLGMPGLTAWFGLLEVGQAKAGETVVVSGAAGAVGSVVVQIARRSGCRVVGIAGSEEKVRHLTEELGADAAVNYKTTKDLGAALASLCPQGVDVYFDNVGGPITDAVFPLLNVHARVAVCGQISLYNLEQAPPGPRILWDLIARRIRVEGFLVSDFLPRWPAALAQLGAWVAEGRLTWRETVVDGLENAPAAFIGMMRGENLGKQLVRVADE